MRQKWEKSTDSDFEMIAGRREVFLGKLRERYGYSKQQAERELADWEREQVGSKVA
jgi:uncharacterized protein YjbJ (UPF0337 family)